MDTQAGLSPACRVCSRAPRSSARASEHVRLREAFGTPVEMRASEGSRAVELPGKGSNLRPPGNSRTSVPLDHLAIDCGPRLSPRKHAVRASGPSRCSSGACSVARDSNPDFRDETRRHDRFDDRGEREVGRLERPGQRGSYLFSRRAPSCRIPSVWPRRHDSNVRRPPSEGGALSTELRRGGATDGTRTRDLLLDRRLLHPAELRRRVRARTRSDRGKRSVPSMTGVTRTVVEET